MSLDLNTNIFIIAVVFSTAALLAVCLRFYARAQQHAEFSIDDILIIPGALCAVGVGIVNAIAATQGRLGRHMQYGPSGPILGDFLIILEKCEFANELLSLVCLAFTKLSIVFFYRRIFRGNTFSTISTSVIILIVVWGVGCFFAQLFNCIPIAANWDVFGHYANAKCFNPLPLYYGTAGSDMIIDLLILIIPQPLVWKLRMPRRKRAAVSVIFVVGAFVIGISAARIAFFVQVGKLEGVDTDKTYFIAPALYWTQLECAIAVVCACLPTMGQVFSGFSPERVLKSWASKISLRTAHKGSSGTSAEVRLSQWAGTRSATAGSASSILRNKNYTCEAVPLSNIEIDNAWPGPTADGIYVQRAILHETTGWDTSRFEPVI